MQTYEIFKSEYEKVAKKADIDIYAPSRAQFHRWLAGDIKQLPQARHCRVLATMFPEWQVDRLFDENSSALSLNEDTSFRDSNVIERFRPSASSLAALDGNLVLESLDVDLEVGQDGIVTIEYIQEVLNLTDKEIRRIPGELWFTNTDKERLDILALDFEEQHSMIQRVHDTANLSKFAYKLSPSIQPGETGKCGYRCSDGTMTENFNWRQSFKYHTFNFNINIRHVGHRIGNCTAIEEQYDGSERIVDEALSFRFDEEDSVLNLTLSDIRPGGSANVYWDT